MKTESTCTGNCCQGRFCTCHEDRPPRGTGIVLAVAVMAAICVVVGIAWRSLQ